LKPLYEDKIICSKKQIYSGFLSVLLEIKIFINIAKAVAAGLLMLKNLWISRREEALSERGAGRGIPKKIDSARRG